MSLLLLLSQTRDLCLVNHIELASIEKDHSLYFEQKIRLNCFFTTFYMAMSGN